MNKMWQYYSHLKYTLRHKFYVFVECCKEGLYIRGITHDLSKFSSIEFSAYANFFFEKDGSKKKDTTLNSPEVKEAFEKALKHHQSVNDHHFQYWIQKTPTATIINHMSLDAVNEMVCDWKGAAKSNYEDSDDNPLPWYRKNRKRLLFHTVTRMYLEYKIRYDPLVEGTHRDNYP